MGVGVCCCLFLFVPLLRWEDGSGQHTIHACKSFFSVSRNNAQVADGVVDSVVTQIQIRNLWRLAFDSKSLFQHDAHFTCAIV